jgi:glycerophosphoryl diester phosphodiesterase
MEVLKQLRKRDHRLALGVLADIPFPDLDFVIRNEMDADTYHFSAAMLGIGGKWQSTKIQDLPLSILTQREILRQLRLKSIPALVYTVNDPADARALLEIDRISIFSDDVQALLPVISGG